MEQNLTFWLTCMLWENFSKDEAILEEGMSYAAQNLGYVFIF